ncbi:response regulator receiver protein [Thiorhodococcus drewsii AZ1]|uniref:Response regulator receiver protein n=1 Tax=Thiorhodococcus drewsii AZ1 TaxID=765913 RepID=G2E2I9_9GAMM|nr:response regulator [Thiorhodococcus drewsii]EGV30789.1 response regulator receiver protein [Thiorhodococcus drewsii AZ1]
MTLHILHIEDEPDIREVVDFALEEGGFRLTQCASGEEALTCAPELSPDLILLDVMMPGMDGPTTLQKLRALQNLARTPVIFMTAKVQPKECEYLKALGALGVISKPFDPMRLGEEIRALLQHPLV